MLNISSIPGAVAFKDVRRSLTTKGSYGKRSLSVIKHIVVHHSATTTGSAEAYARYHVNDLGWPGIGYALVIEQDGTVKWCNDIESITYHVGNSNTSSVGVCLTGSFDKQDPTAKQWKSLYAVINFLMGKLPNVKSVTNVRGHQEMPGYSWKPCPSLDMDSMRGQVKAGTHKAVKSRFQNDQIIKVNMPKDSSKTPATSTPGGFSDPNPDYYVIQKGDTLWGIANNNDGLTLDELMKLNPGINPKALKVGQRIKMRADAPSGSTTYVIKKGDTFWDIAKAKGVTVDAIQKANPKVVPTKLQVGQKIVIPKKATGSTKKPAQSKPAAKYPLPSGTLKSGSKGTGVKQLQTALNAVYFKCGTPDGIYGAKTKDAVYRFQSVYCNPPDGIYGSKTKAALEKKLKADGLKEKERWECES